MSSAEHANMDRFSAQAWQMLLTPAVRDLAKEPEKLRDRSGAIPSVRARCWLGGWWKLERASSPPPVFTRIRGIRTAPAIKDTAIAWRRRSIVPFPFFWKIWRSEVCSIQRSSSPWASLAERLNSNPALGRDHWPNCWSLALGGGGIRGGHVVAASDQRGFDPAEGPVSMGDILCHYLQGIWHRLGKGIHEPGRAANQNRQCAR